MAASRSLPLPPLPPLRPLLLLLLLLLPLAPLLLAARQPPAGPAHCPPECACIAENRWAPDSLTADCSNRSLKALSGRFSHHVTTLKASFNNFQDVSTNFFGHSKIKIRTVILSNNSISRIEPGAFAFLSELSILNLTGNHLEYLHVDTFVKNVNLTFLILRENRIKLEAKNSFLNARKVGKLDLSFNNIPELYDETFDNLPGITYLRLNNNKLRSLHNTWFRNLKNLESLFLENNHLTSIQPDTFIYTPRLMELGLSWNKLVIPSDTPFLRVPSIDTLYLSGCDIGRLPPRMFDLMPRVRYLFLNFNRLRRLDIGLLRNLEGLTYLEACGNGLLCDCSLREVWEWCSYKRVSAKVSCSTQTENGLPEYESTGMCVNDWDAVDDLVCNWTATAAPREEPESINIPKLAGYASLGTLLLLAVVVASVYAYWRYRSVDKTRSSHKASNHSTFTDMMPLHDEHDEVP